LGWLLHRRGLGFVYAVVVQERLTMGLFGKLVATAVNVATLPVAVVKDVFTLGNAANAATQRSYTVQKLEQIKDEAKG